MTEIKELIAALREDARQMRNAGFVREGSTPLAEQAASALEALISRSAVMEEAIIEAVDHARPYKDESGIIEIPLHPFGGLSRVRNEIQSARSALSLKAGKE